LQHGVAQVFETLVVTRREVRALVGEGAVRHGLEQQSRVAKVNAYLLLELL
jgi:hypothetical protein